MTQGHSCKEGQVSITIACYSSVFGCTGIIQGWINDVHWCDTMFTQWFG